MRINEVIYHLESREQKVWLGEEIAIGKAPRFSKLWNWIVPKLFKWKLLKYIPRYDNRTAFVQYDRYEIDRIQLDNIIYREMDMIEMLGYKPKYLVLGHSIMHELLKRESDTYMTFDHQMRIQNAIIKDGRPSYIESYMNLKVTLVPWIEGFFVLPELPQ